MASIYQRGETWWVHYYVNGKSVSRSLKTTHERVAIDRKKKLEALEITGQLIEPSRCDVATVVQSYCEYRLATSTRKGAKNDLSYLRGFFGPCCKALALGSHVPLKFRSTERPLPQIHDTKTHLHVPVTKLEQVSTEMVNAYVRDRIVEDKIAPKTANRIRGVLQHLFNFAIEHHGYVCPDRRYRNPVQGVRRLPEQAPQITWLNAEQISAQLSAVQGDATIHAVVSVYIYSGLRREEALWLTWEDVDLQAKLIRVRAKTLHGEKWQPKTKRNRVVPISQVLLKILLAYASTRKQPVKPAATWFFVTRGGRRWDPDNLSQRIAEVNEKAGLDWSCLDYRHTFGSQLAQRGISLLQIAELMGNSPEICRRHYAALVPEKMHDAVEFTSPAPAQVRRQTTRRGVKRKLQRTNLRMAEPGTVEAPFLRLVR